MLEQTNFAFAVQEFEGKVVSVYAQSVTGSFKPSGLFPPALQK